MIRRAGASGEKIGTISVAFREWGVVSNLKMSILEISWKLLENEVK